GGNVLQGPGQATADPRAENLFERATLLGERIRSGLTRALQDVPAVTDIRGQGLMIGIELDRPCAELVQRAADAGLLINVTAERVIRLLPPLIFSDIEADQLVNTLAPLIADFVAT
ncbi:MAG TPA: aminotransferase class III-fold pyridoxal phosphate-dependent enzyme, partial [Porticoccaceae bacterium]